MTNTWIELDLESLSHNLQTAQEALGSDAAVIFVVKSNAYGHGLKPVAGHAWKRGIRRFAVAHVEEALTLRALLPEAEILVIGVIDASDAATAARNRLTPVIVSDKHGQALAAKAAAERLTLRCHVEVDTGMGRTGLSWENAAETLPEIARLPGLDVRGVYSHFASSNDPDRSFADTQVERFNGVIKACRDKGLAVPFTHMANSGAVRRDAIWDMDGARMGIALYGYGNDQVASDAPVPERRRAIVTRPFLHWKTRVLQVRKVPPGFPVSYGSAYVTKRETHIATIDVGYADGYSRLLSNRGTVLAGGRRVPVAGRVTMNLTLIDLGPRTEVTEGDEVVLLGTQGKESIWADEMAERCGTISYEILTSIRANGVIAPSLRWL